MQYAQRVACATATAMSSLVLAGSAPSAWALEKKVVIAVNVSAALGLPAFRRRTCLRLLFCMYESALGVSLYRRPPAGKVLAGRRPAVQNYASSSPNSSF